LAIVAVPGMAMESSAMMSGTDILGNGIFESSDGLKFPVVADTNFDSITVGNDNARAIGFEGMFPFFNEPAKAVNNLEIKKNQQVGPCECCNKNGGCDASTADASLSTGHYSQCQDCCTTVNIDQVHVGDRTAQAYGNAEAENNVKLVLNQAP
jgi:hypothetical protein